MHPIVGYLGFGLVIVGQRFGKYMIVGCLDPQGFGTHLFGLSCSSGFIGDVRLVNIVKTARASRKALYMDPFCERSPGSNS